MLFPEARNSDIALRHKIIKEFYFEKIKIITGEEAILLNDEYEIPNQDSIKRIRATIQNDKNNPRYLPTSLEVAKNRRINEEVWRAHLGYNPEMRQPDLEI